MSGKNRTKDKLPKMRANTPVVSPQDNGPGQSKSTARNQVLYLQQALGNKAVQRLIQTNPKHPPTKGTPAGPGPKGEAGGSGVKTPLALLREELDDVFVDEDACLKYIGQLGPAAATVRKDSGMMSQMASAFNAAEMLQAVQRLRVELKWSVYWLNQAGEADSVGSKGYDILISAATARQVAELIGWKEMLGVVKANHVGNPLTMFPPLVANKAMLGHVFGTYGHYIDWILESAGPQQLLRFVASNDPARLVDALVSGGKWKAFLGKLPKGLGLMPADQTALFTLFDSTKDINRKTELFESRFNVKATKKGGVAWEPKGLRRTWQLLNMLPAADVEGNSNLDYIYRAGSGSTEGESDMSSYVKYWYDVARMGQIDTGTYVDPGDPMHKMNIFDGTIIHEIGHSVDGTSQKYSKSYGKTPPGGGWVWHTAETAVDAMIAASPWTIPLQWDVKGKERHSFGAVVRALAKTLDILEGARKACVQAATKQTKVRAEAKAIDPKGTLWKLIKNQTVVKAIEPAESKNSPWMNHGAQTRFGTRYIHQGYPYPDEWYSYLSDRFDAKLSKYQFRDPSDWFAETYAAYYMTVNPSNPKMEDAGKKVPEPIKTWFRENVAKTSPPPGGAKHKS